MNTLSVSLCIAYGGRTNVFQMSLTQKFKGAVSGAAVNITAIYTGTRYPVLHCESVDTSYGVSVCLTLSEDAEDNEIRIFLPRHYCAAITEEDMATINNHTIQYYLTNSNRPMLQMDV